MLAHRIIGAFVDRGARGVDVVAGEIAVAANDGGTRDIVEQLVAGECGDAEHPRRVVGHKDGAVPRHRARRFGREADFRKSPCGHGFLGCAHLRVALALEIPIERSLAAGIDGHVHIGDARRHPREHRILAGTLTRGVEVSAVVGRFVELEQIDPFRREPGPKEQPRRGEVGAGRGYQLLEISVGAAAGGGEKTGFTGPAVERELVGPSVALGNVVKVERAVFAKHAFGELTENGRSAVGDAVKRGEFADRCAGP